MNRARGSLEPRSLAALLLVGLGLCGCQSAHPLGDDFAELSAEAQLARTLDTLREAFSTRLGAAGEPLEDREVLALDAERIAYRAGDVEATLAWDQVARVDVEEPPRFSGTPETQPRPAGDAETLRLLLEPGSPAVADEVRPLLAHAGLTRAYVELAQRPPRTAERVRAALSWLRRGRPAPGSVVREGSAAEPEPAPEDPSAAPPEAGPEPESSPPSEVEPETAAEAELRRLKRWHAEGLISDEDYARERRKVLDGLR
ncbi:MAG: hypothetical protein KDD82_17505 [Planctomycetes bacterium]|nr:hypothetical protein [Planctomycetota bacterium]